MKASLMMEYALLASTVMLQMVGCAASRASRGTESSRALDVPAQNGIEAPGQTHEPSSGANAEPCAMGWMQIQRGVCVRFSKLEPGDDPRFDLVAMDVLSRVGYLHLNLRIAVYRGARKWCAYPEVLSLYRIEANRPQSFRVPCSLSGTRGESESGELRLVVEVDEALEIPRPH